MKEGKIYWKGNEWRKERFTKREMSKGSKDLLKERNADGKYAIKDAKDIMNELKNMKRLW